MKKQTRLIIKEPDIFDILSATWILASNDESEIMTYEGIKYRLSLPDNFAVKGLIQSRGELFRKGLPRYRLREWKEAMLAGRRRPSWILDIEDPSIQKQRIEALTTDEVFRSQFRAEKDAPRSPIEIIDWGLQHIDRPRKASMEAREESIKRWQLWAVLIVSIINITVTITVAIIK